MPTPKMIAEVLLRHQLAERRLGDGEVVAPHVEERVRQPEREPVEEPTKLELRTVSDRGCRRARGSHSHGGRHSLAFRAARRAALRAHRARVLRAHPRARGRARRLHGRGADRAPAALAGPLDGARLLRRRTTRPTSRRRAKIGRVHVRVGLPQRYMFTAMALIRVALERDRRRTSSGAGAARRATRSRASSISSSRSCSRPTATTSSRGSQRVERVERAELRSARSRAPSTATSTRSSSRRVLDRRHRRDGDDPPLQPRGRAHHRLRARRGARAAVRRDARSPTSAATERRRRCSRAPLAGGRDAHGRSESARCARAPGKVARRPLAARATRRRRRRRRRRSSRSAATSPTRTRSRRASARARSSRRSARSRPASRTRSATRSTARSSTSPSSSARSSKPASPTPTRSRPSSVVGDEIKRLARAGHRVPRLRAARSRSIAEAASRPARSASASLQLRRRRRRRAGVDASSSTCPPPDLVVDADAAKIEQVLLNLVQNAIEALAPGGGGHGRSCARGGSRGTPSIEVEDDGPGLAEPGRARSSTRSSRPSRTGTGLGLAIAHRIVTDHGGTDRRRQPPGRTVFRVTLPARGTRPHAMLGDTP